MTRDDIIRMTREACLPDAPFRQYVGGVDCGLLMRDEHLERFAALVAAPLEEEIKRLRFCIPEGDAAAAMEYLAYCVEKAVAEEREACEGRKGMNNEIKIVSDGVEGVEVLRFSKEGIWANPDVPIDEAAKYVLETLDGYLKKLVNEAVKAEREACAIVCEEIPLPKEAAALTHLPTIERCAAAIRARGEA
jgi:hypothetical protein